MNSHNQHAKECYDLIINQPIDDQKKLCVIIEDIIRYKKVKYINNILLSHPLFCLESLLFPCYNSTNIFLNIMSCFLFL